MDRHQRGIGLIQVAIIMASLAAIAMALLMSARHERNFFTEGLAKLRGRPPSVGVIGVSGVAGEKTDATHQVDPALPSAPAGVLRRCTINGKTVLSDVDCKDGQIVKALDTRGIEAPKIAKPDPAESTPPSATEKIIEKATR